GMLIKISGTASNISVINGELSEAWGDGIYIHGDNKYTGNLAVNYSNIYAPTLFNLPASEWTDDTMKNAHVNEIFENTKTHRKYQFTFNSSNSTYSWVDV